MLTALYRSLVVDRGRTALSVLAIAAAIVVVVVLEGFQAGLWDQVRAYKESLPAQLVVTPAGTSTVTFARATLTPQVRERVTGVPGVQTVYPVIGAPAIFSLGEKRTPITIVGYEGVGGPWRFREGRAVAASGETVVEYALARSYGLRVGDTTRLLGRDFRIVGLSSGTASMLGSYVFIGLRDAAELASAQRARLGVPVAGEGGTEANANLLLVQVAPDAKVTDVRRNITATVADVAVWTPSGLADNDAAMAQGIMGPVMTLLVAVAYVAGVLIIGLTLYAAILERRRDYGIMKAVGARNGRLYRHVLAQAAVFTVAGFVVAVLAAAGVAALVGWLLPQYRIATWDVDVLSRAGAAALAMAAVASVLPIQQTANVDPALVFRE